MVNTWLFDIAALSDRLSRFRNVSSWVDSVQRLSKRWFWDFVFLRQIGEHWPAATPCRSASDSLQYTEGRVLIDSVTIRVSQDCIDTEAHRIRLVSKL